MQIVMSKYVVTLSKVRQAEGGKDLEVYVVSDGHRITPWTWTFASQQEAEAKFRECVEIVEASHCRRINAPVTTSFKPKQYRPLQQSSAHANNYGDGSDVNADVRIDTDAQA